jgi:sugar lactone lactonase YvrE
VDLTLKCLYDLFDLREGSGGNPATLLNMEDRVKMWKVDRIVHFDFNSKKLVNDGLVHFGFHDKDGRLYALEHQKHFLGPVKGNDSLEWTLAPDKVFDGVSNIRADISFPIYIDTMSDGSLIVSCFGNSQLYRVEPARMKAELFVDGGSLGMKHAGNCVVDDQGYVWVNEIEGCKIWRFDRKGEPSLVLGNGSLGFQRDDTGFDDVRFSWIYDIRKGPDGNIYVLDSKNFAVRMIDLANSRVRTLSGTGIGGYYGDGGSARLATFGSDPTARFDGPISMSLDEDGNIFVGDRYNHVVRMIHHDSGLIETIAGRTIVNEDSRNNPEETDPRNVSLPKISSMDYYGGHLFVPTDLTSTSGDLIVLRRTR